MSKAEKILTRLWVEFQEKEGYLFENDLSERCISFNFAKYLSLAEEFKNYDVDCEYNRNLDKVKRLPNIKGYVKKYRRANEKLSNNEEKYGITVSPDIIIHRRGEDLNYIVIELKKYSSNMNDEEFDYEKLVGYKKDLKYEYGFFIKFNEKLAFIGEIDDIKKIME